MVYEGSFNGFNSKYELEHFLEHRVGITSHIFKSEEEYRHSVLLSSLHPVFVELIKGFDVIVNISLPKLWEFFLEIVL